MGGADRGQGRGEGAGEGAPILGHTGWFSGHDAGRCPPPSAAALVELCARLGLRRIGRPLSLRRARGQHALSLLAESHVAWGRSATGLSTMTLFSCTALDPAAVARRAAPLLGPGRWRWAARGPAVEGAVLPPTQGAALGPRWLLHHRDPDGVLRAIRAALPAGPERAHAFSPQGRTLARWAAGGWVVIHTWPEYGLLTVDLDGAGLGAMLGALLGPLGLRPLREAAPPEP